MTVRSSAGPRYALTVAACTAAMVAGGMSWAKAQQPPAPAGQAQQGRGGGGGRGNAGPAIFTLVDANKDGAVTRDEMKATFDKWYTEWDTTKCNALTQEQLDGRPQCRDAGARVPPAGGGRGQQGQNQTPKPEDVQAMMAALPATAPAKPKQPRKVLVLGKAGGLRALVDSARGPHHRGDGQEDRRLDDDHHLRFGGHQRGEPQAVRRDLPR